MLTKKTLRILALPFALLCAIGLSACNTMEGAGEDIEAAGEEIQDATDGK